MQRLGTSKDKTLTEKHRMNGSHVSATDSVAAQGYKIFRSTIEVETCNAPKFVDLTSRIKAVVNDSYISEGTVLVFSMHTTAAIVINENEPLLLSDLEESIKQWSPKNKYYAHNNFIVRTVNMHEDECPNGHSHCRNLILNTSESVPIINGKMLLGQFQSVFLVELDEYNPNNRKVCVQVMGI